MPKARQLYTQTLAWNIVPFGGLSNQVVSLNGTWKTDSINFTVDPLDVIHVHGWMRVYLGDENGILHERVNMPIVTVFERITFKNSLHKQSARYYKEGQYGKAIEYKYKALTGKTSDEMTPEQAYKVAGGTISVVGGVFTLGAAPAVISLEAGMGIIAIGNGIDDIGTDYSGNSLLQQQFPGQSKIIGHIKTATAVTIAAYSYHSIVTGSLTKTTDIIGTANDLQGIIMTVLIQNNKDNDK